MRSSWCYWSAVDCDGRATCSWSRLTALLLGRLLGVLLFTEARSMGLAVQWSPMKPESWSGWFQLKSSPTCSCRCLHCELQNVPREHTNCTARNIHANRWEASWQLTDWTDPRRLVNCLEADPSVNTARNNSYIVAIVLRKLYLVTGIPNMWEVSMGGSHTGIKHAEGQTNRLNFLNLWQGQKVWGFISN
jgi:hypothetical protein